MGSPTVQWGSPGGLPSAPAGNTLTQLFQGLHWVKKFLTLVTEGKGSEMAVEVGRDLWRSPHPRSPFKIGQDVQIQVLERIYLKVKN